MPRSLSGCRCARSAGSGARSTLPALALLAEELRALATDILHVPLYSRASPYLRLAARLAGVPLVVAHDWSVPRPLSRMRRGVDRLLRRNTRFIAASQAQERELLRTGVPAAAIAVVHAGIDVERFGAGDRRATRAALGLEADRPVALVPARLAAAKGHDDLISALPAVLAREPRLTVLLAGDGPLAGALADRLRREGLAGSVRLLGHSEAMPDLYAAADFVVLPSRVEGLPSVLLEAYAARRAVVATAAGGVPEALTDGCEGRLVPVGEIAALCRRGSRARRRPGAAGGDGGARPGAGRTRLPAGRRDAAARSGLRALAGHRPRQLDRAC